LILFNLPLLANAFFLQKKNKSDETIPEMNPKLGVHAATTAAIATTLAIRG
jgi:hypothetical protein